MLRHGSTGGKPGERWYRRVMRTLLLASLTVVVSPVACKDAPGPQQPPGPQAAGKEEVYPTPAWVEQPPDSWGTTAGSFEFHPVQHATLWMKVGERVVWVDPWSQAKLEGPKADIVLITDVHGDHFDPEGLAAVRGPETVVVAPKAVADQVPGAVALANGERKQIGALTIEAVAMYNRVRGPEAGKFYHDKGRGNGYVVSFGGARVYFSGDTECTPEMQALKDIDVAFVCMNLPYTMPPAEALGCVKAFRPKVLYPYHYRDSPLDELTPGLAGSGVELRLRDWYAAGSAAAR